MTPVVKKELSQEAKQILYYLKGVLAGFNPVEEPFESSAALAFKLGILNDCFDCQDDISFEDVERPLNELTEIYKISFIQKDAILIDYTITTKKDQKGELRYSFAISKREVM